jgi:uncharacterized protein (DUF1800 family)
VKTTKHKAGAGSNHWGFAEQLNPLDPYQGDWGLQKAAHLLKRTTFGPTFQEIKQVTDMGLDQAISTLLANNPLPHPPVNFSDEKDSVPIGAVWVNAPMPADSRFRRRKSLLSWTVMQQVEEGISIREKMTLFWHNHFAIESGTVNDARYLYQYQTLLRTNALGNFKQLVKAIAIDPTMLRYLDGRRNTKNKPNENFARELLELFTIGKGPIAGPGDYTHYTEEDIIAIARILTGWRDYGYNSQEIGTPTSGFLAGQHDTGQKQLSERFDKIVFSDAGKKEYEQLIDLIFTKAEVAYFICRKIYRWLVNFEITDLVEAEIIKPLGDLLIEKDFQVKSVVETLIRSNHFFSDEICGALIKNPMDYVVALIRQTEMDTFQGNLAKYYNAYYKIFQLLQTTEMAYFAPPNVAGWPAYYQEPVFYQSWINAATLTPRNDFATGITTARGWQNYKHKVNALQLVATIDDAADPNALIRNLGLLFYPLPLEENQHVYLKEILIPGLPDFEWTVEYNEYLSNPGDTNLAMSVEQQLLNLLQAMFAMPEVYLS